MPAAPTTPAAVPAMPDWLAAASKTELPSETDVIALRTAAPARNAPLAKPETPAPEVKKPALPTEPRLKLSESPAPPTAEPKPESKAPKTGELDCARFPSRVMIPETVVMAAAGVAWVLAALQYFPSYLRHFEVYSSVPGALALFQLVRFLFREFAGGYRLTDKRIERSTAGLFPDPDPIELVNVASVRVERSVQDYILCTGSLHLTFDREGHAPVVLSPVGWPRHRAKLIEQAIEAARAGQVVATRVAA